MKNAVYVSNLGTTKKPYCKMGLCAIEKYQKMFCLCNPHEEITKEEKK